jgi:tetratricopeptide (TPR) repeat protein
MSDLNSTGKPEAPELPESARRVLHESARLLHQNRPGEAVSRLLPLYKEYPTDPDVALNLGGAYIMQRKWNRAVAVLQRAANENPGNAMLWVNLGAAELGTLELSGARQQDRAIAAYERALEADPDTPNVHYHLGLIYKRRGELNRASAFFHRALEVQPADRDARYWLERLAELEPEQPERGAAPQPGGSEAGSDGEADDGAPHGAQ